jgi:Family of unknown function (DUF5309)
MAAPVNTFISTSNKANREDLSGTISMLQPTDTPLLSMIGSDTAANTFTEWVRRNLRAPAVNAQLEGDAYTFNATAASIREGNQTQIFRESWSVSRSQNAITNAGEGESSMRAKLEAGLAIKKDVELALLTNTATVGGGTRFFGGLPTWYVTNALRGATGVNGGYNVGTKLTVAATAGTKRAFTQTLVDQIMQSIYINGGNVTDMMVSPYNKQVFVSFMSNANVATFRHMADSGKGNRIVSNADDYDSPYGPVTVTPNRVMAANAAVASNVHMLDTSMLKVSYVTPINPDPKVVSNADATVGVMIGELTLKVLNEQGIGVIADVFGLNATT